MDHFTPGAKEIVIECLPESGLPNLLADRGYDLKPEPDGERILPHAVSQKMTRNVDGTLGVLIEGSTQAVTTIITHAGIVRTRRWSFHISWVYLAGARPRPNKISKQDVGISVLVWLP